MGIGPRARGAVALSPAAALRRWSLLGRSLALATALLPLGVASVAARGDELGTSLRKRVEEVLAGRRPLSEVRLEVVGGRPDRGSLVVYGSGVGVWNQEKQFLLSDGEHKELLKRTLAAGLYEMPERPRPEKEPRPAPDAPVVIRAVSVKVGDLERTVAQNDRVWTLPALEALVSELFGLCEKPASRGTGASSLADGLGKIARGKLAPETLQLVLSIPPVAAGAKGPAEKGLLVVLDGGALTWTEQDAGRAGTAVPVPASVERLRELAGTLAEAGIETFPVNLYRTRYLDLNARVLGRAKTIQARAFAGMDPAKHAAQQAALEKVVRSILALGPGAAAAPATPQGGGKPAGGAR